MLSEIILKTLIVQINSERVCAKVLQDIDAKNAIFLHTSCKLQRKSLYQIKSNQIKYIFVPSQKHHILKHIYKPETGRH